MKNTNNAQTILTIVVGFMVFYFIFKKDWLLYASLGFGVLGLLSDYFSSTVSNLWMKLALILGRINGNILLTIIFFIFLTPIAFLMKVLQKVDALKLKKQENTVYEIRNHTYTAKDLENVW